MADYVYREKERKNKISAIDFDSLDKSTRFFCPNPDCDAHMYICNLNGSSKAYFSATFSKHPHVEECSFSNSNNFNPNDYNESSFDFEGTMQSLQTPSTSINKQNEHRSVPSSHKKQLRTIRQLYDMCKSKGCNDMYNGIAIGQMLLDDRSIFMYPKGVYNYRIIEAKVASSSYFYNNEKQTITLHAPIKSKKYAFTINIKDKSLFSAIRKHIYNNRDKIITVGGKWESSKVNNTFIADITSKKQYHIIIK